ncbi:hypothetical protein QKD26_gp2 [Wenling triplecross lizardfish paramyxovirus]|uniref:Uncharacterized protein n=1 Tax=Wenling triplecross lizardfish paramyxovirus TaxID=2116451 RepID=A0A2P1GN20_9MONO|nr:hypothetical protein QKD26_gp2 [Wenling triplecross lizardfish paramyxovirus]AVM87364.1 hypothetical protein [Wenling triplecross lizardfish paramyxovirus]
MADDSANDLIAGYKRSKTEYQDPELKKKVLNTIMMGLKNTKEDSGLRIPAGMNWDKHSMSRPKIHGQDREGLNRLGQPPPAGILGVSALLRKFTDMEQEASDEFKSRITHKSLDHPEYLARKAGALVPGLGGTDLTLVVGKGEQGTLIGSLVDDSQPQPRLTRRLSLSEVMAKENPSSGAITVNETEAIETASGYLMVESTNLLDESTQLAGVSSPVEGNDKVESWMMSAPGDESSFDIISDPNLELEEKTLKKIWKAQKLVSYPTSSQTKDKVSERGAKKGVGQEKTLRRPGARVLQRYEELSNTGGSERNNSWEAESDPGSSISARISERSDRDSGEVSMQTILTMLQKLDARMTQIEKTVKKVTEPLQGIQGKIDRQQKNLQRMRNDVDGAMNTVKDLVFLTSSGGKGAGPVGFDLSEEKSVHIDDGHFKGEETTTETERLRRHLRDLSRRTMSTRDDLQDIRKSYESNKSGNISAATRGNLKDYTKATRRIQEVLQNYAEFLDAGTIELFVEKLTQCVRPEEFDDLETMIRKTAEECEI